MLSAADWVTTEMIPCAGLMQCAARDPQHLHCTPIASWLFFPLGLLIFMIIKELKAAAFITQMCVLQKERKRSVQSISVHLLPLTQSLQTSKLCGPCGECSRRSRNGGHRCPCNSMPVWIKGLFMFTIYWIKIHGVHPPIPPWDPVRFLHLSHSTPTPPALINKMNHHNSLSWKHGQ